MSTPNPVQVPFAEWLPDLPDYKSNGATVARNVIPDKEGYLPLKALSAVTATALTARARGAVACFDSSRNAYNYAGDATKLYTQATTVWTDASRLAGGVYDCTENWEFVVWGQKVIAVNIDDASQIITMGGANFAALGGSPPQARHIGIIGQFVVMANLDESATLTPNKVRWSGINNEASWTASATTQADSQVLYSDAPYGGGWIMKVVGGAEYGIIFQEYAIWRMTYIGSPAVFDFTPISVGVGTPAKNSVVSIGEVVYFLGQDGFYALAGSQPVPISHNKISRTFLQDVDTANYARIVGTADPKSHIIVWIYPSTDSDGTPDKAIIYDYINNRFADAVFDSQWIYSGLGAGSTLESLDNINADLDAHTTSFDAEEYKGGSLLLAAFDTSHQKATFTGTALSATLETAESDLTGTRSLVDGVRPLVDGDAVTLTARIKTRNKTNAAVSSSSTSSPESGTNIAHFRAEGRYHRVQVNTTGTFSHAIGCDVFVKPLGYR